MSTDEDGFGLEPDPKALHHAVPDVAGQGHEVRSAASLKHC